MSTPTLTERPKSPNCANQQSAPLRRPFPFAPHSGFEYPTMKIYLLTIHAAPSAAVVTGYFNPETNIAAITDGWFSR